MRRGPSIRRLLIGVNILTLLMPLGAMMALRLYNNNLVHQTEQALISESVVIGEAWRDRWLEAQGMALENAPPIQPPGAADELFPVEATLNLRHGLARPSPGATHTVTPGSGPEWVAGARIRPLLERAKRVTLSGARVLDTHGCIVATSGDDLGLCFDELPEVKAALAGHYQSVARERVSNEATPPLDSIQRGSDIRVYTALPVFSGGRVIGVVRLARTSLAPLKALWLDRRALLAGVLASVMLTLLVSFTSARTVTRPVREITAAAQAIARGEPRQPLKPGGVVPSEVFALSEALDTMTRQLSDRAAYISEFAANVSHELKTPLTGIGGAAELLRDHWETMDAAERLRFLDNIRSDVDRMERLVTRLLQLARIQSAPAEAEEIRLRPFFEELAAHSSGQVRLDLTGAPETIVIHPDHLHSAVRNLVDNAIRYGTGQPVEISVRDEAGRAVISVRDHGPGISEGNQAKIFGRFFTTDRDRGGTGLGLSIVQAVATTRGGSVRFDTGPGGTTFVLVL